ncbi:MAG TPA: UPF0182 family protein [Gemmatimonadaceae bacterium]|nr:UPF0182 family protein [Gemmatimonadaceae bacterium]
MTRRRWLMLALAAAAVLLLAGRAVAGAYADYLWYESVGAGALWRTRVQATLILEFGSALLAALFAFCNLYAVRQSVVSLVFPRRLANLEIGEEVPGRYLMGAAITLSVILAVLLTFPSSNWMSFVLARWGGNFSETDPYFGFDLSFFVYWLPFETALWTWAFIVVIVVGAAVILLYALTPSLRWRGGTLQISAYVRRHLTVLAGVVLLMTAWSFRLDMYSLLSSGSGPDGLFGYVDHRVAVPGDLLLSLATLGAALIVVWAGFVGQFRLAAISVLTAIVVAILVREVAPIVAEHSGTDAERSLRERPYAATRASYTRRAYAIDAVERADSSLAYPTLSAALPWVPVWDPPALTRAVDMGRLADDQSAPTNWVATPAGVVAEVVGTPPAGASARAPWTVARVRAADADERGAPVRLAGQEAPASDDTPLDAPLVYPGASAIAIIPDSLNHAAGTSLESFFVRLATAWSMQNFRILTQDLVQPSPTLISHRDIHERVGLYVPFFEQGRRVQPVLVGDTLYWSVDLYSASDMYPLSWRVPAAGAERSYFHHAAVAIVQASTGETVVVPDSVLDPVATAWVHHLPSIFGSWSALPAGLRPVLAPPLDGTYAQAMAFGKFGTRSDSDTPRHVPLLNGADSALVGGDVPFVLPGGASTAIALPLVDDNDRLRGLFIGVGGGAPHTMWYQPSKLGPRWGVVLDRLRSLDSIGVAMREGPVLHGRVRTVPVASGIGFVQPAFRWRPENVPSLIRIALLAGDSTRTLTPPTSTTFAHTPEVKPGPTTANATAAALYAQMRDALRHGDWAAFGRAFEALGRALGQSSKP